MNHRPCATVCFLIWTLGQSASGLSATERSRVEQAIPLERATVRPPITARIVNGLTTSLFPSVVSIIDPLFGFTSCSGTLIGCDTVLTAAHCVCDATGASCQPGGPGLRDPADFVVYTQHGGFYDITEIIVHPDYEFAVEADVALLKLLPPVSSIAPSQINLTRSPPNGTTGLIAGFGISGDGLDDTGLKRYGEVVTAPCATVPEANHVCWDFLAPLGPPGEDSNTCNGDSGGPLFLADPTQLVVGGITSGGAPSCEPDTPSFDTDTYKYRDWIQSAAGSDTTQIACGPHSQAGSFAAPIFFGEGTLTEQNSSELWEVEVTADTRTVLFSLNGDDTFPNDFDLYVRFGQPPTDTESDCAPFLIGNPEVCQFDNPAPGTWYIRIVRFEGEGDYQTTATLFAGDLIFASGLETGDTGDF